MTGPQTGVGPGARLADVIPPVTELHGSLIIITCDEDKLSSRATLRICILKKPIESRWLQFDQLVVSMQRSSGREPHKYLPGHSASAPPLSGTSPGRMGIHKPKHWSSQNLASPQMF